MPAAPLEALAAVLLGCLMGCASSAPPPPPPPADPDTASLAAAGAFLQCAERTGPDCRPNVQAAYQAWEAIRLLARIRDGSPVALLAGLHEDMAAVYETDPPWRTLVTQLSAVDHLLHDAICRGVAARPLDIVAFPTLVNEALARAERLGLLASAAGADIQQLAGLAEPMATARVVETHCNRTGLRLYLVLAPAQGAYRVVNATTVPPSLGMSGRQATALRLPVPDDVVTPFIPVSEDAL